MLGREHAIGHPVLTDAPTGLANRLHFELVYSYLFNAADRGVPLTVMLVSTGITENEPLGHLGERLQSATRASDLVAHLGEGRIAVLMMGTNISGARVAADRVEMSLQDLTSERVSIGIAAYVPDMKESVDLLEAVDKALRAAETAGGGIEAAD